jgi:YgiT-type zinc finger domain-containing protein
MKKCFLLLFINMIRECPTCGGELVDRLVSYTFKRFGQEFTYHNIKAEACLKCGEQFLDGPTVTKIEREIRERVLEKAA